MLIIGKNERGEIDDTLDNLTSDRRMNSREVPWQLLLIPNITINGVIARAVRKHIFPSYPSFIFVWSIAEDAWYTIFGDSFSVKEAIDCWSPLNTF